MEAFRNADKSLLVETEKLIKYDESKLKAFVKRSRHLKELSAIFTGVKTRKNPKIV